MLREPQKKELFNSVLGNYFLELELGNYQDEEASDTSDTHPDLLQFSWDDNIDFNIVELVSDVDCSSNSIGVECNDPKFRKNLKFLK